MNTLHLLFAVVLLGATALSTRTARAQTASAVTDPVGYTTLGATAAQGGNPGQSYVSLDLVRSALYRGLIPAGGISTANGSTVLTFPAGTFMANQFNGTGNACYLELKNNGAATGYIANITATTDSTITLADDVTSAITAGSTTFVVRPHWTFGQAFGSTSGFQGSITATNADTVTLINPTDGVFLNYYFNTTNNRWQRGVSDATNIVIPPNAGVLITRKAAVALTFTLVGDVKLGPTQIPVIGGDPTLNYNLVANPYPLASVTLANSGLYTGSATTGVVGSITATAADTVTLLDSTGTFLNFYYNTTNSRWQRGVTDASNVVIPAGAAVLVTRKNARASFNWYVPQPSINL